MSGVTGVPEGITNPPIDELLSKVDSKYALVLYSAKRARQINAYYSQLGEGLLEYVGPLVDTHVQEKPLSIAMREISADLLTYERIDGDAVLDGARADIPAATAAEPTDSRPADQRTPMSRIVLGVAGGIAAYKSCELLRRLTESGHSVRVVPTAAALQFVGAPTWAALSGHPVTADPMVDVHEVPHVRIGQEADLVVVAPATANVLAKAAHGLADDLLTNVLLTAGCPVVMVPAMHTEMWEHPATVDNVATLRGRGVLVVEPAVGRLTGADIGKGRMPEPPQILEIVEQVLGRRTQEPFDREPFDLRGRRVVVSAGGTREALDPVRFLGNRSSGRQGYALAATAASRGAQVDLVSANVDLPPPAGVSLVDVSTAAELKDAVLGLAAHADAVVMAAAVADFRPATSTAHKLKKDEGAPTIVLEPTDDVLSALVAARPDRQVVVGFAAETGDQRADWLEHGRQKLARKGCDLLVVNEVGEGLAFGTDDNAAVVLGRDGSETVVPRGPKRQLAHVVWDLVQARWPSGTP